MSCLRMTLFCFTLFVGFLGVVNTAVYAYLIDNLLFSDQLTSMMTAMNMTCSNLKYCLVPFLIIAMANMLVGLLGILLVLFSKHQLLNKIYAIAIVIVFVATMIMIIIQFVDGTHSIEENQPLKDEILAMIHSYDTEVENEQQLIDQIQMKATCCGAEGPSDWESEIPETCCEEPDCDTNDPKQIFEQGCGKNVQKYVKFGYLLISNLLLIFLAIPQVICIVCGLALTRQATKDNFDDNTIRLEQVKDQDLPKQPTPKDQDLPKQPMPKVQGLPKQPMPKDQDLPVQSVPKDQEGLPKQSALKDLESANLQ